MKTVFLMIEKINHLVLN